MLSNCMQLLGDNLFLNVVVALIMGGLAFVSGLVVENSFDVIKGKNHRKDRLKKKFRVALDCIHQAEQKLPGKGLGQDRFELAIDLYQEIMGSRSLEDKEIVQLMFQQSSLSH